jgi:DNA-binding transcriptional MerR regulator
MPRETYSISELCDELGIQPSAVRYYEHKGLIKPERTPGNPRVYNKHHRARLKLILRGKRFGASLEQIGEMIGMADRPMNEKKQIDKSLWYIERRIEDVLKQKHELDLFEADLLALKRKLARRRRELEKYRSR